MVSARLALSRLFNVSSSSPWICFGGSYAGSLASWARLKVPGAPLGGLSGEGTWTLGSLSQIIGMPSPHISSHTRAFLSTNCLHKSPVYRG